MNPRILVLKNSEHLINEFKKIGVDSGGIPIMLPKGISSVIKVCGVISYAANILKQEMLSLGGDVALSRNSITGRDKKTDCLIMGNLSQVGLLISKLEKQPFGLSQMSGQIKCALENFEGKKVVLNISGKKVFFRNRTLIMGIINTTADSFSGDGVLGMDADEVCALAEGMVKSGADILDIGGESSRPGSKGITAKEELKRILPVLKCIIKKIRIPVSVDTTKVEVAHAALDSGVAIVNDISALRADKKMAKLVARYKAVVVLTHMKGKPFDMQKNPLYKDAIGEIYYFLDDAIKRARDAGIAEEKIVIDPGIGFGKTTAHNIEILKRLSEFKSFGRPILVGLSRKKFIGEILNTEVNKREWGTAAALSFAIANGADIVRVHDVKEMKQVVSVADAITKDV